MAELPTGTVTFLFTDIEGSTRLLDELGSEGYSEVLAEHHRRVREAMAKYGGMEVDTQGDAFFVTFSRASDAVAAAAAAQERLAHGSVRVRMGIHTGEPIVTDEGYVGIDVHRAARIAAAGHGGQILVSQTTHALLENELHDLGEHRLKDLTAPVRLYQVGNAEFPPLKTLFGTNLPVQPTPLVGRERELEETANLLRDHRVVTLLGPGGSGKTRLALQAAANALDDFSEGVYWVPLQSVIEPGLVEAAISRALGAANGLVQHVGDKRLLLLLDNFEHLLDAAGDVARLVGATPNAKALITSREPLRISAEQRYSVEPLPEADAITLFVERARAIDTSFMPDSHVEEICRRLDGLPLAIELAAARVNVLDSASLAVRLEKRLSLLTSGSRDAPVRQQTLRATIEWSHDLLEPSEQEAFRRLAVFAGSFDLEAAEAVCELDLDTLASLVEKSLVRRWGSGRFGLLETIQEYARERLAETEEESGLRQKHAAFFLAVAETAHLAADTIELGPQPERANAELDNLRAALRWAQANDIVLGLELATALEHFWVATSPYEGLSVFEELFAHLPQDPPPLTHARALRAFGGIRYIVGEFEPGVELLDASLAEYRKLGDEAGIAHLLNRLAVEASRTGDLEKARTLAEQGLEIEHRLGSRFGEAVALGVIGTIEWAEENAEEAFRLAEASAAMAAEVGFDWWQLGQMSTLCEWSLELGRVEPAEDYGRRALELAHRIEERMHLVHLLAVLARVAAETGRFERAGIIWGGVEREESQGLVGQWEDQRSLYADPVLAHDGPEFAKGRELGRSLSLDEVVEVALSVD